MPHSIARWHARRSRALSMRRRGPAATPSRSSQRTGTHAPRRPNISRPWRATLRSSRMRAPWAPESMRGAPGGVTLWLSYMGPGFALRARGMTPFALPQPSDRGHDLLGFFERHHVASFRDRNQLRSRNGFLERVRVGRNDQLVAVTPDENGLRLDPVETVRKPALRNRKENASRHAELPRIGDEIGLQEFRVGQVEARRQHRGACLHIVK